MVFKALLSGIWIVGVCSSGVPLVSPERTSSSPRSSSLGGPALTTGPSLAETGVVRVASLTLASVPSVTSRAGACAVVRSLPSWPRLRVAVSWGIGGVTRDLRPAPSVPPASAAVTLGVASAGPRPLAMIALVPASARPGLSRNHHLVAHVHLPHRAHHGHTLVARLPPAHASHHVPPTPVTPVSSVPSSISVSPTFTAT